MRLSMREMLRCISDSYPKNLNFKKKWLFELKIQNFRFSTPQQKCFEKLLIWLEN